MAFYLDPKGLFTASFAAAPSLVLDGLVSYGLQRRLLCRGRRDAWAQGRRGRRPSGPSTRGQELGIVGAGSLGSRVCAEVHPLRAPISLLLTEAAGMLVVLSSNRRPERDAEGAPDGRQLVGKAIENLEAWPKTTHATVHIGKGLAMCVATYDMRRQWPRVRRPHASLRQRRRRQPALRRAPCQMDSAAAASSHASSQRDGGGGRCDLACTQPDPDAPP